MDSQNTAHTLATAHAELTEFLGKAQDEADALAGELAPTLAEVQAVYDTAQADIKRALAVWLAKG